ncbi:uncharacterized protein [Amphiura filiformis]|uniref:uncharacterized protein n=1 Tax=Amphiura filiformis TaxID=82378 RepID=UPI003B227B34
MGAALLKKNVPVDIVEEGPIQMLNIDTLLVIFNYLSLYDKLMAMRVSKKWHQIIKNHAAWTVIDFRDKGPIRKVKASDRLYRRFVSKNDPNVFEYRECGNEWQFQSNENDVLNFMTLFAGVNLQEIYLNVVNDEIMSYLRLNCPNINTLGLRYIHNRTSTLTKQDYHKDYEQIQRLYYHYFYSGSSHFTGFCHEHLIPWLENCLHLRTITIRDINLTSTKLKKLSEMKCLRELDMSYWDFEMASDVDLSIIGTLTSLTYFRLELIYTRFSSIDGLLQSIAHWTHLKVLALKGVTFKGEAFEMMLPGILNLETLELNETSVTSSVFDLIGIHLKKLKTLELIPCYGCISSFELQLLSYHPMLENLVVQVRGRYGNRTLYEVLSTLPRIKNVKILLDDISHHFSRNAYPVIQSAEIEVSSGRYMRPISSSVVEKKRRSQHKYLCP